MPKQLINIVGTLAVVLVVVLGIVLGVVPLSSQTGQVHAEATTVRQTNDVFDAQVRQLKAVKKPELEDRLSGLRTEIPATNLNDDVFELVIAAAGAAAASIESVTATERKSWTNPLADEAGAETSATDQSTETADDATSAETAEAPSASPEDTPRTSVPFTLNVKTADISLAVAFVDALRAAPRLVRIEQVTITQDAPTSADVAPLMSVSVTLRSLVLLGA